MYHIFIHSSVKGHLGCFHVLAILIVLQWTLGIMCLFELWFSLGTSDSDTHQCHLSCWSLEQCLTHSRHSKFVKRGDSRRILVNKSSQVLYFNSANNQTQKEYGGYLHISHGTIVTVHSISCATAAFIYTLLLSLL